MNNSFKQFIEEQLLELGDVGTQKMFGGYGIYFIEQFFGIIHKDRLYFKTSDKNRKAYLDCGMKPFQPNEKQTLKNYYEVPVEILEDEEQLCEWAKKAIEA